MFVEDFGLRDCNPCNPACQTASTSTNEVLNALSLSCALEVSLERTASLHVGWSHAVEVVEG